MAHIREQSSWPSVRRKMVRKLQREGAREVQVLPVVCEKTLQEERTVSTKKGEHNVDPQ